MFGDLNYRILTDSQGTKYLVRYTSTMWSDMFGGPKKYVYRINPIGPGPEYHILPLVDTIFSDLDAVKEYLRG
jgi:hypothetical protein